MKPPEHEPHDPLAAWADRALRQIPSPRAPQTLAPRILEAVRRRAARPWYRRSWSEWPPPGQFLGLCLLLAVVAGVAWLSHVAPESAALGGFRNEAAARLGWVAAISDVFSVLGRAGLLLIRQVETPYLMGLVAVGVAAWMSCLGLGTAVWRLAHSNR